MYEYGYSIGKGRGRVSERKEGWTEGDVVTPHGIVSVYAQGDDKNVFITRLDFAWKGRMHIRSFQGKRYSPRGIVTKAKAFAKEIVDA